MAMRPACGISLRGIKSHGRAALIASLLAFSAAPRVGAAALTRPVDGPDTSMEASRNIESSWDTSSIRIPGNSLEEYLKSAAANSPSLRAAFYQWKAAAARVPEASSLPDPVFSYGYFIESIETRVGPQKQRFGVRQKLPWFGKRAAASDAASEEAGAAYARFEAARLDLFYQVEKAYYDYYIVGKKIDAARSSLDIMDGWDRVARARYESSSASRGDLIRIQIERERIAERLAAFESEKEPALAAIRSLLDLPQDVVLPVPEDAAPAADTIGADRFRKEVLENNPLLAAAKHALMRDRYASDLARKKGYPDLVLGFDYIDTGEAIDPSMPESGKDPWMVTMSFELPIWFGKHRAARRSAEAAEVSAGYRLKSIRNELEARSARVLFEFAESRRRYMLYRDSIIPLTEEALAVTFRAYEAGEDVFADLVSIQRDLFEARLQLEKHRAAVAVKRAEAGMMAGGGL